MGPWWRRGVRFGFGLLVLLSCCLVSSFAQATQPSTDAGSGPSVFVHTDPTFGFELMLPTGWAYDRTRYQGPFGGIGLLRGTSPAGRQSIQIYVFRNFEMLPFDRWLIRFERQIVTDDAVRQVKPEPWRHAEREGALLEVDSRVGSDRMRLYYCCLPFDPNTVWVLVYAGVVGEASPDSALRERVESIGRSLRVLYDPLEAERLGAAFERGKSLLRKLKGHAASVSIDAEKHYYEILLDGKSIGYLTREVRRESRSLDDPRYGSNRKAGIRVEERSWRFSEDGSVRATRVDAFASFDFDSELLEVQNTLYPAPDVEMKRVLIKLDQCVREYDVMFSSFSTNLDGESLPDPRQPIRVGDRYLSAAWLRLLPGLLLTEAEESHAFAVYDSPTRALITHTILPLGKKEMPGVAGGEAYAFDVREGFVQAASRLYTDGRGKMLRMEAGELVLRLRSGREMEERYGQRRIATENRFR